jgi:hypothetical protein
MSCESTAVAEPVVSDLDLAELAADALRPTKGCTQGCSGRCG